ncbi:hypothetical protein SPRG_00178 [Saprolegnia parasitica CBS 223.65]|uniref:Glycine-rich protein n=1 Tax=Saprolegnia parasitica (strain CBS 223.65) TaxID=695850 RepID=A0A067CXA6_SAPPC|nr:hypothetical protein SPRG_00178 [Saprolegnia parasitica CBS 223.65]KDO35329.1 hypothetical protein SPRG_00178 [Saprolegnia parasitica CBS 223.65]|eukprot:XP_012193675.1 hypothetical protein SPRG_00178 [Saprolegnia parasitica CBS 223.65]
MKITLSTLLALAAMAMADSTPAAKDKPAEAALPKGAAPMSRDALMEMDYEDYRGHPDMMDEHWHGHGGHWHGRGGHWHGRGGHWHGHGGHWHGRGGHWHGRGGHWHGHGGW